MSKFSDVCRMCGRSEYNHEDVRHPFAPAAPALGETSSADAYFSPFPPVGGAPVVESLVESSDLAAGRTSIEFGVAGRFTISMTGDASIVKDVFDYVIKTHGAEIVRGCDAETLRAFSDELRRVGASLEGRGAAPDSAQLMWRCKTCREPVTIDGRDASGQSHVGTFCPKSAVSVAVSAASAHAYEPSTTNPTGPGVPCRVCKEPEDARVHQPPQGPIAHVPREKEGGE